MRSRRSCFEVSGYVENKQSRYRIEDFDERVVAAHAMHAKKLVHIRLARRYPEVPIFVHCETVTELPSVRPAPRAQLSLFHRS